MATLNFGDITRFQAVVSVYLTAYINLLFQQNSMQIALKLNTFNSKLFSVKHTICLIPSDFDFYCDLFGLIDMTVVCIL